MHEGEGAWGERDTDTTNYFKLFFSRHLIPSQPLLVF